MAEYRPPWEPVPPDPAKSSPRDRRDWMVRFSRSHTRELALEHILSDAKDHRLQVDQLDVVAGHGFRCKAPNHEIIAAANEEWAAGEKWASNFLDALRRKLWSMCRAQMPELAIIAAADGVMWEWGVFVPDDLLMPLLERIWNGTQSRRRTGRMGVRYG